MSRVAVITSSPPMAEGGHMVIARALTQALRDAGHHADIIVTPQNPFGRQASSYLATWLTDVTRSEGRPIDRVISLRYPSYAVRHPAHVCWLNHTMREYYDLWPAFSQSLSRRGRVKERVRRRGIHAADRYLLTHNVNTLFVQSKTIAQRLSMWSELTSTVLYPPAPQRPYRRDEYGRSLLFISRLTPLKRADLVVRALAEPIARGVTCVFAGDGDEAAALRRLAADLGVADRATFVGRVDEGAMLDLLAGCRAVVFPPLDEDYGFVTVEAFASRTAVITCRDSGGPAELVEDGVSGRVSDPTPRGLAAAMAELTADAALAARMGEAAFDAGLKLTWAGVVKQLVP
jgi:glycosyltransferase involved in cell wall biosynthesis